MANEQTAITTAKNGNGPSQAMVTGPQARLKTIKELFEKSKGSIAAVLPKHLTPDRLIKIATSAASRNPELLDCTPESLLLAVVQAGTLGLEPSTPLGHAYLVPFNNKNSRRKEATLIIGYRGLCQLAYQSGDVTSIYAEVIHKNDAWDIEYGTSKRLYHKPRLEGDPGDVVGFYAVIEFRHGGKDFVFMSKAKVDEIRMKSQGANSDAWVNHYEEQGKKTAIRRLSKTAPMSSDKFARAVEIDARASKGDVPDYSDVIDVIGPVTTETVAEEPRDRAEKLAAAIGNGGAP